MRYDVTCKQAGLSALFDLKGPQADLWGWAGDHLPPMPARPNSLTRRGERSRYHIGPRHLLLRTGIAEEEALERALGPAAAPPQISIVRISDTLTFFAVTGRDADQVMAIACPLDLHPAVFGADAVSHTEAFGLKAMVLRCEGGFECAVEQSHGDMMQDYLNRALT